MRDSHIERDIEYEPNKDRSFKNKLVNKTSKQSKAKKKKKKKGTTTEGVVNEVDISRTTAFGKTQFLAKV